MNSPVEFIIFSIKWLEVNICLKLIIHNKIQNNGNMSSLSAVCVCLCL